MEFAVQRRVVVKVPSTWSYAVKYRMEILKTLQLTLNSGECNIVREIHVKLGLEEYIIAELLIIGFILRGKLHCASGIVCQVLNVWSSEISKQKFSV